VKKNNEHHENEVEDLAKNKELVDEITKNLI